MKKITLSAILSTASLLAASAAQAQDCPPGSWLCAGLQIGAGVSGGVVIGGPRNTPPPPPPPPAPPPQASAGIVVQGPVVEFQPAPQPVYEPQPVYVHQPQQVFVYRPAPVIYTTSVAPAPVTSPTRHTLGLGAYASGLFLGSAEGSRRSPAVGGAGVMMRYRHAPHVATEVTLAGMYGTDYNGDRRAEIPVTMGGVFYFNPQNRFQVYTLLGAGLSFASVLYEPSAARTRGMDDAGYLYLGGYAGIGAEWQLSRSFALFFDVRGFIRGRVDRDAERNPEFSRVQGTQVQTSNLSTGLSGQFGGMFWF